MNATLSASQGPERDTKSSSMKSPLVASLVFHGFLILLFSGAFFIFSKPVEIPSEPMSVEILPVTETASSLTEAPIAKKTKEPEEISEEPPPMAKVMEPNVTPKSEPPKPKPAEREKIEDVKKPEATPIPLKKAEVADKKRAEKPKPPEKKPEAAKKEEVKKEEEKPVEDAAEFSSVLKNLVGDEQAEPTPDSVPRDTPRQAPQLTSPAPLGAQLSMSEMDALRAQLAQCWIVPAGARDAEGLLVDIEVTVAADKTVTSSRVVDQLRYGADGVFRAAADSAMRALKSPACTPLALPDNKYDQWKDMTVQFDPKNMF